jgi:energy-coupling factor transporter ATP-binding protein EcfA2
VAHSLILGQTESGKTTLAKRLAAIHHASGEPVIVLDPFNDPEWKCSWRTTDVDQFLAVYWKNRGMHAFIDEGADTVGRFDDAMRRTATAGRHWGHSNYYISQRGASLNTTVRAQCRHLFLFASTYDDCKVMAKEFNAPDLIKAADFPAGRYFHKARFAPLEMGELWSTTANSQKV